jgi:hypothetical protein
MARTQRIALAGGPDTYTVVGVDELPIGPAEEFLQFLRDDDASPNTVKAYAAGLAAWWTLLEHTGTGWCEITTSLFGQFLAYLRSGDLPRTARIGAPAIWLGPASVQLRAAAVLACYRYHADAHALTGPYQRLHRSHGTRYRSPLHSDAGRGRPTPVQGQPDLPGAVRDGQVLNTHFVFVNLATGVLFAPIRPETVYAKVHSLTKRSSGALPVDWTPHWLRHPRNRAAAVGGRPARGDAPPRARRRPNHTVDLRMGHRRRRDAHPGPVA